MIKPKSIFISGGSGFLGRNITEQLQKKYKFYAPTHNELNLLDEEAVQKYFKTHKIDVVIHAAKFGGTRKQDDSLEIANLNLKMFFNIVRNKKHFKKMIFLGSGGEYDHSRPLKGVKEEEFDKIIPNDIFFGLYKYICSKYIEEADNIINLRLFGIYGKYEDYEVRFISNAICKNIFGMPITIKQNVFFDYVYIDDFVKILDYFIYHKAKEKFYNIGTGKKIDLLTIANIINKIAVKKSEIIVKKKGLNKEYTCDNLKLKKEIKNLKFSDHYNSIVNLYEWYSSIKNSINKELLFVDR